MNAILIASKKMSVEQAKAFATTRHAGQVRKFSGEPYVTHCERVALTVAQAGGTPDMVKAAWLHDTLEDTQTTVEEIELAFGPVVARLVQALTNDTTELARVGKTRYLATKVPTLCDDALLIKLADRLDNTRDLRPANAWSGGYAVQTYSVFFVALGECGRVLPQEHLDLLHTLRRRLEACKWHEH